MDQHIENTHPKSTEPVGDRGPRKLRNEPWTSELFKLPEVELRTNKVSSDKEAVR